MLCLSIDFGYIDGLVVAGFVVLAPILFVFVVVDLVGFGCVCGHCVGGGQLLVVWVAVVLCVWGGCVGQPFCCVREFSVCYTSMM